MRFGDQSKVGGLGRFSSFFSSKQKGKIPMNQPRAANENATSVSRHEAVEIVEPALAHLTILVATAEPAISTSMRDLLAAYPLRTIWARGVDEVRSALSRETVDACFCGFWLIDGTYREVVRHLKRQPGEIPAIVVCAPSCPQEYRDYLAALNLRAFDFLCHPYRRMDLERILRATISKRSLSVRGVLDRVVQPDLRKAG
jgi:CheY-like chemotaxis protein